MNASPLTEADCINPETGQYYMPGHPQFWINAARGQRQMGDEAMARQCERRAAQLVSQ